MKKIGLLFCFFLLIITSTIQAQTAKLWGMTPVGGHYNGGVIFTINPGGSGFDTVYSFNTDIQVGGGDSPHGDLLAVSDGKLYGTTFYGGTDNNGTIFSFDSTNKYTDLHDFDSATGYQPYGNVIIANNGDLYGMTSVGGAHNFGVIFRFNPDSSTYADVHDFDSTHGSNPYGNLLRASNGKLYGMTQYGGAGDYGVIFVFDPTSNSFTDTYEFDGTNGSYPYGSFIQSGNKLFGLASSGGTGNNGVIFSYTILSNLFSKLYDFNFDSGGSPDGSLTQLSNGIFYGTANSGGVNGDGVIFSYDSTSNTYHDKFDFNGPLGQSPPSGLLLASDGNLYGMTFYGGTNSDGIIFNFSIFDSVCNDIHDFNNTDGASPNGNLIETGKAGINQLAANKNQILIYPNPASELLTVISKQLSVKEIRVQNMLGQTVIDYPLTSKNGLETKQTIDVSALPAGMYFVNVISENEITTGKVVVK